MKYKICYIDDLSYAIPQVINSIPKNLDYEFYYYNRISDIEDINFDIILLDFYLDKDNKTALDIIQNFSGIEIIAFSSVNSKNDLILENGGFYKALKLKNTLENKELEKILSKLNS